MGNTNKNRGESKTVVPSNKGTRMVESEYTSTFVRKRQSQMKNVSSHDNINMGANNSKGMNMNSNALIQQRLDLGHKKLNLVSNP